MDSAAQPSAQPGLETNDASQQSPSAWRVAAYITAYNDAEAFNKCLMGIRLQTYAVDYIFVVDNSSTPLLLTSENQADPRLTIWHHPENVGISGGLEQAAQFATQAKVDFLWLFDQDSYATADCLEKLLLNYEALGQQGDSIGIIAPTAVDARTSEIVRPGKFLGDRFKGFPPTSSTEPYDCDVVITSGSLLWLKTLETVALPDARLFIDGIDLDHGIRLKQAGFRNLVVPQALMYHRFGHPIPIRVLGKAKNLQLYPPLRHYYICRNHTYLELQHAQGLARLTCLLHRIRYLMVSMAYIGLFDRQSPWSVKLEKWFACWLGTFHGLIGQLDHRW